MRNRWGVFFGVVCTWMFLSRGSGGAEFINFNRDIRPILSENCFACHGPDEGSRMANLRLDTREGVFSRGLIVPGKPEESELFRRITATGTPRVMPPTLSGKRLKPEQREIIRRWIASGAAWSDHWAFVPPTRPSVPEVKNKSWVKNPLDAFILARLEAEGLSPSPEADKRTLIRRLSLDLTGLPPTREEIREFLADNSPDAYEKLVERLLAKPQYGEHMARYWLDAARYGDTHGLHLDNYREMWPYRDWVINAFNKNMPYHQFAIEQIAGDLLPNATLEQRIATGFERCNVTTSEGGSIDEEYYVRYAVDRVNTTSTVFLGLTMGCAQCHDHKYDPFSQKEYYQLFAFFNNITENAMDGNQKAPPPVVKVPSSEQKSALDAFDVQIASLNEKLRVPMASVEADQREWEKRLISWRVLEPTVYSSAGKATLTLLPDTSLLASGENPPKETYELVFPLEGEGWRALRVEALTDKSLPMGGAGRSSSGNAVLTEFEVEYASAKNPDEWKRIPLIYAWADYEQPDNAAFQIFSAVDGKPETGWAIGGHLRRENRQAVFLAEAPFGSPEGGKLRVRLKHESEYGHHTFGRFRVAVTDAKPSEVGANVGWEAWYSLGVFPAHEPEYAFLRRFEPEGKAVNVSQEFKVGETTLKWVRHDEWENPFAPKEISGSNGATYLYRNFRSDARQRGTLLVETNGWVRVWWNQQEVVAKRSEGRFEVSVELRAGNNEFLMKLVPIASSATFAVELKTMSALVPVEIAEIAALSPEHRSDEQAAKLRDYYREHLSPDESIRVLIAERAVAQRRRADLDATIPTTLVMEERKEPRGAYVLKRGQYDQRGEPVQPDVPAIFPPMPSDAPRNRLGFAMWLVDPSHPLTARVAVNRLWQQLFGVGIVKTQEDFGNQGERPSHPELLDWLATEFVASGWDVKAMVRLMVTSATYRQSSSASPELYRRDPENRLYARGPRFRLDAEVLRDQALAVSGLLRSIIGGPSVKPPQPEGLWEAVGYVGSNTRVFVKDAGPDKVYRRSLYTFWKRTSPPPQMSTFDAPTREACVVRRERTNTPLQALLLMNDPQYVEAARAFAERTLKAAESPQERLTFAFETATARLPSPRETETLLEALRTFETKFQADPEIARKLIAVGETPPDASLDTLQLAAWTMLMNVLLNLDEVLTKG